MANKLVLCMRDYKTSRSVMSMDTTLAAPPLESVINTAVYGLTDAAVDKSNFILTTDLTGHLTPVETDVIVSDIRTKALLIYKVASTGDIIRFSVPAPRVNVENGICVVGSGDAVSIPAIAPVGATGKGGEEIGTQLAPLLGLSGASALAFLRGRIIKKA